MHTEENRVNLLPKRKNLVAKRAGIALAAMLSAACVAQAAPLYSIESLGAFNHDGSVSAMNGGTAVGFTTDKYGNQVAAEFSGGAVTLLSGLSVANGINSSGTVVGTSYSAWGTPLVAEWSNGKTTSIYTPGYGNAINDSGQVAGAYQKSPTQLHAFIDSNGHLNDLGTLGGSWSSANAINGKAQVAGTSTTRNGTFHAFFGDASGISDLGTLGGSNSYGTALNSSGQVVGTSQIRNGNLNAFAWTKSGMVDLGTLGGSTSAAYGVNDLGQIVGYSSVAGDCGEDHAFLYSGGIMLDLNSLLPSGSDWSLEAAYSIDNAGDILGIGDHDGSSFAVELKPLSATATPEPSVFALLGAGLLAIAPVGKRKRTQAAH